ncbi:MAG TPA: SDR family NAD(P)-dependent oxidoreductase [Chitinophagales bacterium]|nr:SDR family NAD(P)-dependent oxidoreductase [Chitinophagales bacterium]
MRILIIHSDYLKYNVKNKTGMAEEINEAQKSGAFDESLVIFSAVEKQDEINPKGIVKNLVKEVIKTNEEVKADNIVLYPYAHLSSSLSSPQSAIEILKDTDGKGVDVVLNSLVGEAMYKSLQLLNNFGRFIEIGKKDIFENSKIGMEVFRKSLSYFMVDAEKLLFEKPELLGELLHEISALFEEKQLEPLPFNVFNIAQAKEAFRLINTSKHIGKIVINIEHQEDLEIHKNSEFTIDEKATYLLTGGLGGLGLQFTKMLVEQGAKNIILLGRKAPSSEIESTLENYRNVGVNIITYQADVSNKRHLQIVFNNIPVENPLKGVFHLAGLLDDASIINLTEDKFYNVLLPKVFGALYLHELTKNIDLDYFVLFSSSAVLFASPGQSAYVAANAYLDGLAQQRKAEKLAALSIQWSTVADVGLAAVSENRSERLKAEGIEPLLAEDCTNLFQDIANIEDANIGIFKFDVQKWQQNYSTAKNNPYFSLLTDSKDDKTTTVLSNYIDELKLINDKTELEHQIEQKIKETLAKVTKISIDKISTRSTFKSLGIDSLMSIQLKNQLEHIFEIKLSVTAFWTHATIKAYAKFLIDKLSFNKENSTVETELRTQEFVVTSKENETPKTQDINIAQLSIDDNEPSTENQQQPTTLTHSNNEQELEDLSKLLDDELKDLL